MSVVKGVPGDINPEFLSRLDKAFPEIQTRWRAGDSLEELANRTGHREVIEWITKHARMSSTG